MTLSSRLRISHSVINQEVIAEWKEEKINDEGVERGGAKIQERSS